MNNNFIKLIECPRDAMQGWTNLIPTEKKIRYINQLLHVGFDTIDFGSFVSPKAIPQMADTAEVLQGLDLTGTNTQLLAIVANVRGAEQAASYASIRYIGFPLSVSETFQQRNTNSSISESLKTVATVQSICNTHNKELVVYLSMGFGNPYGDEFNPDIVLRYADAVSNSGVKIISLADTVGLAEPQLVQHITDAVIRRFPDQEIGVHLHSTAANRKEKTNAALDAGCLRFDGAIKGIGGCPMAGNTLVGNMDTEFLIRHFTESGIMPAINHVALGNAVLLAGEVFV